jgi:YhcH/YjgK/YiaL family protein
MVTKSLSGLSGDKSSSDPSTWSSEQTDSWFEKGEWLNGWEITPDSSIDKKEFALSYFKNKSRWDMAFAFLKNSDFTKLEKKRHDIHGDNIYAIVSEYITKKEEDVRFEAHKRYIDIQYVFYGSEIIGVAPSDAKCEVLVPYDSTKDIEFMNVNQNSPLKATPNRFFIFFPSDLHRPGVRDGEDSTVRKVVLKVKIE